MTKYCITFEDDDDTYSREEYYYAAGLIPDEVFEFFNAEPSDVIKCEGYITKILGVKTLYQILGEKFCSEVVEEDEDLKDDVDKYGLGEVVNNPSDHYGFRSQLCRDRGRVREFFRKLGMFAADIRSYNRVTTFVLPLRIKHKPHLKEDLENIVGRIHFYYIYVYKLNNRNVKEDLERAMLYYSRDYLLDDSDVDYIASNSLGINTDLDDGENIFIEDNDYVGFDLNKYKLVRFVPDGYSIEEV